jgi:nitrate/nitrite transporter NarK
LIGVEWLGFKGWQSLFILEAIPAVVFAFVLVVWLADSPDKASWLSPAEKDFLTPRFERETAAKTSVKRYTVLQALADKEVLKMCGTYFLWITGFWGFGYWMPTVLKAASGWSNLAVGWMIVAPMILSVAVMLWISDRSSRTGERRWHGAIGMFIGAAGLLLGTMTERPIPAFVFMCMAAIGVYAPFGVWWSYPTTFLSGPAAAGAIGLINSCGNVGGFLGPYLIGFLKDFTGSYTSAWLYLGCSLIASGCLMLTFKKESRSHFDG